MPLRPEFRAGGLQTVLGGAFLIAVVILLIFGSTGMTVVVGATLVAIVLAIVYYLGVRIDRWARGGA